MTSVTSDRRQGLNSSAAVKVPCRVASTASLGVNYSGLPIIDGVQLASGDRVLRKDEADPTLNGIWNADTGNWTRALDFDGAYDAVFGTMVKVNLGGAGQGIWTLTTLDPITIGSSLLVFSLLTTPFVSSINVANTIAVLRAFAPGAYPVVQVLGFAAPGDGGAGIFWWNAADVSADDGGTIIQANAGGNGRWNKL